MARPHRLRLIENFPDCSYFKPQGIKLNNLNVVVLKLDEYETLRLKDYEGLSEIDASKKMEISQPTFNRLYVDAKKKIVKAIIEGLAIKIEGGNVKMPNRDGTGPKGEGCMTGRGLGKCNKDNKESENNLPRKDQGLGPCGKGLGRGLSNRRNN